MDPRFCGSTTSLPVDRTENCGYRKKQTHKFKSAQYAKNSTPLQDLHLGVLFWFMGLEWIYRYATVSDSGFLELWLGSGSTPSAA